MNNVIDSINIKMIGGGVLGAIAANTDQAVDVSVNILSYRLWDNGAVYITPSTIMTIICTTVAIMGAYRAWKNKSK